jgi:hypothetical protein
VRVIESGRIVAAEEAHARRYAARSLRSIRGRGVRLRAAAGLAGLGGTVRNVPGDSPLLSYVDRDLLEMIGGMLRQEGRDLSAYSGWVLLRHYPEDSRRRHVLFLFESDAAEPSLVVKTGRCAAEGGSLGREHDLLAALRQRLAAPMRATLPEPLSLESAGEHEALLLTHLSGRPLAISMQRSIRPHAAHESHLAAAGKWLAELQQQTASGTHPEDRSAVHGDFWPRNVLFTRAADLSGVIDWEGGTLSGSRRHDLFSLPLLFALEGFWRDGDPLRRFRRGFLEPSPVARAVRRYLDAFRGRASVDLETLREWFLRFLEESEVKVDGEGSGWRRSLPWGAMRRTFHEAKGSVFSG